ncbi:MAG: hypothetical protein AMXMBFR56_68140 [Polyangiaceae bacterium]
MIFSQLGLSAFQNKVYADVGSARAAPTGDVELVQCDKTGLVFNRLFNPELLVYDEDYQNEQALAPVFQTHLHDALHVIETHLKKDAVGVEIGCGKGVFLRLLTHAGYQVTGLDPAYQGDDPRIERQLYDAHYTGPSPDFIVLRHVLEHIADPWGFLADVASHSSPDCIIYIEVPCFDWIARRANFFDVFYEHVNYFTADVLNAAFGEVSATGTLFGEQYLFIVARLSTFLQPRLQRGVGSLQARMTQKRLRILEQLRPAPTFVWGAGAKGVTFANILWRENVKIEALIDINPVKQGKHIAVSGLPVVSPDRASLGPCNVVVMNSMYEAAARRCFSSPRSNLVLADAP